MVDRTAHFQEHQAVVTKIVMPIGMTKVMAEQAYEIIED